MDILYVVLLFLQKKNKKELLCRNCGGNAGFTDGMADAYRKRLDAVLDSCMIIAIGMMFLFLWMVIEATGKW